MYVCIQESHVCIHSRAINVWLHAYQSHVCKLEVFLHHATQISIKIRADLACLNKSMAHKQRNIHAYHPHMTQQSKLNAMLHQTTQNRVCNFSILYIHTYIHTYIPTAWSSVCIYIWHLDIHMYMYVCIVSNFSILYKTIKHKNMHIHMHKSSPPADKPRDTRRTHCGHRPASIRSRMGIRAAAARRGHSGADRMCENEIKAYMQRSRFTIEPSERKVSASHQAKRTPEREHYSV